MIATREATPQEILEDRSIAFNIKRGWKISYRHFVRELYNPRARNGVSHRQHSRSKIYVIDGHPHVRYQGEFAEITGTHVTFPSGQTFIGDLRIKSEYLT
ncbi:MAG TPA: hypothetical protein VLA52_14535 [Thermohalobaculum sp.]|nr:hypothetical protein [Thermohalobaculum sp.]